MVALIMCASSLFLIHVIGNSLQTDSMYGHESMEPGDVVTIVGEVMEVRQTYTGGHLVIKLLTGTGLIDVFIPGSAGAMDVKEKIGVGMEVTVTGIVEIYRGELEIVVRKSMDVVVCG